MREFTENKHVGRSFPVEENWERLRDELSASIEREDEWERVSNDMDMIT